jgi:hypothetical protein
MHGYSRCIYRSYSCWGNDDQVLAAMIFYVPEKSSFPGTGFSGKENVFASVLNKIRS